MTEQTDIKLSDNILIPCPEKGFAYRKVVKCFTCEYYGGIARATERGKPIQGNAADVMQVICKRPVTRKLIEVIED